MATPAALLTLVEIAITARLEGGAIEEYTVYGVSTRKSSLAELFKVRDRLKAEIAAGVQHGVQFADLRGYS